MIRDMATNSGWVRIVEGDLKDVGSLDMALSGEECACNIDTIFHLCLIEETTVHPGRAITGNGGYTPEGAADHIRLNLAAMEEIISFASSRNVGRVVYCSSWSSYGIQSGVFDERTPSMADEAIALGFFRGRRQAVPYFVAKRRCEEALLRAVHSGRISEAVILQPCTIFGPYGDDKWSAFFSMLLRSNGNLPGLPGSSSFVDARDLANAFIAAATEGPGKGECYLIGGTNASNLLMMKEMARLVGVPPPRKATPRWLIMAISRWNETLLIFCWPWMRKALEIKADAIGCPLLVAKICQDQSTYSKAAQTVLGYKPRPLIDILRGNYEWLKENGGLQ